MLYSSVNGQSFSAKVKKLSVEDGLSNRSVRMSFQDERGFIWLATNYGLNRYDGYAFTLVTKENNNLTSNAIQHIYQDSDTCLWVTFFDGDGRRLEAVDIVDTRTFEVKSLKEKLGPDFPLEVAQIFEFYQADSKSLFIVGQDKLVYEYEGNGVCEPLFRLTHAAHTINQIVCSDTHIWVMGVGYISEYERNGKFLAETELVHNVFADALVAQDGKTLKGYVTDEQSDELLLFAKEVANPIRYEIVAPFSDNSIKIQKYTLHLAPNELTWHSNQQRFCLFDQKGKLIYDFSKQIFGNGVRNIFDIYFDKRNNVWIGTSNGLFILTIQSSPFNRYLYRDEFLPNSQAHSIRGITEDNNGRIYINSYQGRYLLDPDNQQITKIVGKKEKYPELDAYTDHAGNIWFCGEYYFVQRLDPKTGEILELPCKYSPVNSRPLNIKLYEDSNRRMWMGTGDGIYYLDSLNGAFIKYHAYGICEALNHSRVYAFWEDEEQAALWLGTSTGLYKFDYVLQRFTRVFNTERPKPYYLPHASILSLHKDATDPILWIGTDEGGLIKWSLETAEYEQFTVATGLSDNVIYSILEDNNQYLWLSSNYGLMRFDKATSWCKVYLPRDGVTEAEFNTLAYHKTNNGRFYFGGLNGLISFDPNSFQREDESDIPMQILRYEYLRSDSNQLEDRTVQLLAKKKIILEPQDNFFRLTFSLLDYKEPSQNRYAYKIEGAQNNWQYLYDNEVRVNRLPYGKYTLVIRGQGSNGQWSSDKIRIPLEMQVPFYQTYTFFILLVFLFVIGVVLISRAMLENSRRKKVYLEKEVYNRTQKLLEREQELLRAKEEAEQSSHAKAEFLSIMSHEIRTPMNAVVNLTNYLIDDGPEPRQVENLSALKFSANNLLAIINDVLDFNKIESGKITFERIDFDLRQLMDSIYYGMSANAKQRGIDFELEVDFQLKNQLIGDPNRLTQVLNNLIGNAIKFTEEGQVTLRLRLLDETSEDVIILFEVEDTGIGIGTKEQQYIFNMFTQAASDTTRKYGGTGLGLAITKRLLQLQGSEIELHSEVDKGSTFSFVLDFDKGKLVQSFAPVSKKQEAKEALNGAKILVVEDNAVNVLVVRKFLKKWGVEFSHAADGLEAVAQVKENRFDLILMDIHMPNMDGYDASRAIRALENGHGEQTPIIALTASALMDNRERMYEAGMNDIVVKPFKPLELYNVLTKYLGVN